MARTRSFLGVFLRYWLPVLVYVALIFALSSVANLAPPRQWRNADKLAHLVEYWVLGLLLARAWWGARVLPSYLACALVAIITGLATGLGDELFQAGVPGRVSSAADFAVDGLGVTLGAIVYGVLAGRRNP